MAVINRRPLPYGPAIAVSAEPHRGLQPLDHDAFADACARQDALVASSCRVVAALTMGGEQIFQSPDGNGHPSNSEDLLIPEIGWYTGARARGKLTPGCFLACEVLYVPAGAAMDEIFDNGSTVRSIGRIQSIGEVRVVATFTQGVNTSTRTASVSMVTSREVSNRSITNPWTSFYRHGVPYDAWGSLEHARVMMIAPDGVDGDASVLRNFSENCEYQLSIEYLGGARIVDCVVYEVPFAHAQSHDDTDHQSVHCYTDGLGGIIPKQTSGPQTKGRDVDAYDERRFGTQQMARVSRRQLESCGPRILHWTPYTGAAASSYTVGPPQSSAWQNHDQDLLTLPASTTQAAIVGTATDWSALGLGWRCDGVHARPSTYNGPTFHQGRGYVPVRLWVYAAVSGGVGTVILKSAIAQSISVRVTATTPGWVTATGWIECQADGASTARALIMPFYTTSSGETLQIGSICLDYEW